MEDKIQKFTGSTPTMASACSSARKQSACRFENKIQRSKTQRQFDQRGAVSFGHIFSEFNAREPPLTGPYSGLRIRSRSEDGLCTQLLLNEKKLRKYIDKIKRECNADFEALYKKIQDRFSHFRNSPNQTVRFLHIIIDLSNKVRDIKRKKIYGKKFWGIVSELDNLKKELSKYKLNEVDEFIDSKPTDFKQVLSESRIIEKLIELFIFIVFKMGRLISYHYAINGKTISEEMNALNTTPKNDNNPTDLDSKLLKRRDPSSSSQSYISNDFEEESKFGSSFVHDLPDLAFDQPKPRPNSKNPSESYSPIARLLKHIQDTQQTTTNQAHNASRSSFQESKLNLTHIDEKEAKIERLTHHLNTFLEKECPAPTIVCRICEERIPVFNQQFHTGYCEKRREILLVQGKRIRNQVYNAYAELNKLVNFKRKKAHFKRSESMLENKTHDFDTRKALLKSSQNSVTLSRSQSKLLPTSNRLSQNNITNSDDAKEKILKKQRTAILEKSLHLGQSQKKRSTTTGEMKRTMIKNMAQQKAKRITQTSNASSSSSKISPNTSKVFRKEDIKRLVYSRGYSYQSEQHGKSLMQRRGQNLHISLKNSHPGISDFGREMTSLTPGTRVTPFFNESFSEQKRKRNQEAISNQQERDEDGLSFQDSVKLLQGTPSSAVESEWANVSKGSLNSGFKAKLSQQVQKQQMFKKYGSHSHDQNLGYFTEQLHQHFLANQFIRKGSTPQHKQTSSKPVQRIDQEVPCKAEFLSALNEAVLEKKSNSKYSSNFLMKSQHSSHEGSDNNSVENMLDHLGAKPFGESIDQISIPNSRRNSTKSKFSAKTETKSAILNEVVENEEIEEPRVEIFDTATDDQVEESIYSPLQIKRVPNQEIKQPLSQEPSDRDDMFKDRTPILKRRQSLFAAVPNQNHIPHIVLTRQEGDQNQAETESPLQLLSTHDPGLRKLSFLKSKPKYKQEQKQSSSSLNQAVPPLDLLSLQRSKKGGQFLEERPDSTSPRIQRGINRKKKASTIDPQKEFSEEKSWREVSKVANKKEVIQSFKPIKRMKKQKRVEVFRKDQQSKQALSSGRQGSSDKIVHLKKIRGMRGKLNELNPSHSFGREKSYKTMGSLKTAATDNSFMHKNLNSLSSYISHKSTNSLQALAQITETAKQQYLQPLTKESLSYDLQGTLEKIDIQLKKYDFPENQLGAILSFKASLQAKYDLSVDLAQLQAKISSTLDEGFYWQNEGAEQSSNKELNSTEKEGSVISGPFSLQESTRNPLRRSESGVELYKPNVGSVSMISQHSAIGRSHGLSQRMKHNYNSSASKQNSGSRSPGSDVIAPDLSQQPQIRQLLESMNIKSRSNSASSTNTTKSRSRLEQIDEKKEACQTSPLRTRAPKKKSRFNCTKPFEPQPEELDEYHDKAESMLQNQSFQLEYYQAPKKELTIVPEEAKAVNSTYNQFDGGDLLKIESLQQAHFSKLLSEMQLKRTNSNCSKSDRSNSNESPSGSFSDSFQGQQLMHLKSSSNKSALSPRRPRDKWNDFSGKMHRSQTKSPINPIKEEANEGRSEDFFQIKRMNVFEELKGEADEQELRNRKVSKDVDRYQVEGESFNVVIHKDKQSTQQSQEKVKLSFMNRSKLQRASDISLDESMSGMSEGMLSMSAIQPNEATSDRQNLVSQNSGTVNILVAEQTGQINEEIERKESSELQEQGSVQEEPKGTFTSYLEPKSSKLLRRYPIKRTSTTIHGKQLFEGTPLLNTNEQCRRNTVAQPAYKSNSSRRIKQKFADLKIQKTLFAIKQAVTDAQPSSGKQPLLEKCSFSQSNNHDALSMPDMQVREQEADILSSFEEVSQGAQSDHILEFGHFLLENLDYFGDQKDEAHNFYNSVIEDQENSGFTETSQLAESLSGDGTVIVEATNESQEESKSEKRKDGRQIKSSRMVGSRALMRLPLQR